MSFYVVAGKRDTFFVQSQDLVDANPHVQCVVGTVDDAKALLAQTQLEFLEENAALFSLIKETMVGEDAVWTPITSLDEGAEEDIFQVFDTTIGQHIRANGKQDALKVLSEVKERFLAHRNILELIIVEELPEQPGPDPFENAGVIPVGVM